MDYCLFNLATSKMEEECDDNILMGYIGDKEIKFSDGNKI